MIDGNLRREAIYEKKRYRTSKSATPQNSRNDNRNPILPQHQQECSDCGLVHGNGISTLPHKSAKMS